MNLDKLTSGEIPTGVLAAAGIVLLVLVFKVGKTGLKTVLTLIALGLLAGAVWWHLHHR